MNIECSPVLEKNKRWQKFSREVKKLLVEIDKVPSSDSSYSALHDNLKKLQSTFESYAKDRFQDVPEKVLMLQAFQKCFVDCTSMGVHRQAILTLGRVFETLGPSAPKCLPLFVTPLFVTMPLAAFQTVPDMRFFFWEHLIPLGAVALQPVLDGFLSSLLPLIEDSNAGKEAMKLIDALASKLEDSFVYAQKASAPTTSKDKEKVEPAAGASLSPSLSLVPVPQNTALGGNVVGPRTMFHALWDIVRCVPGLRPHAILLLSGRFPKSPPFQPANDYDRSPDTPIAPALFQKLGCDAELVHSALCAAANERSELAGNRFLELLVYHFALHDPAIFTFDEKVDLLCEVLPLGAVNKHGTLTRFFRWLYGGTDLRCDALAYYRAVSHRYLAAALERMIPTVGPIKRRNEKLSKGELCLLEKPTPASPIRTTTANLFNIFSALMQRDEADTTFHALIPEFVRAVAAASICDTEVAAECRRMFDVVPIRMFFETAIENLEAFSITNADIDLSRKVERILRDVMIHADIVAQHLALHPAANTHDEDIFVKPTVEDFAAVEHLLQAVCNVLKATVPYLQEMEPNDEVKTLLTGAKTLKKVVDGVLLPLRIVFPCALGGSSQHSASVQAVPDFPDEIDIDALPAERPTQSPIHEDVTGYNDSNLSQHQSVATALSSFTVVFNGVVQRLATAERLFWRDEHGAEAAKIFSAYADIASQLREDDNMGSQKATADDLDQDFASSPLIIQPLPFSTVAQNYAVPVANRTPAEVWHKLLDPVIDVIQRCGAGNLVVEAMRFYHRTAVCGRNSWWKQDRDQLIFQAQDSTVGRRCWTLLDDSYASFHVEAVQLLLTLCQNIPNIKAQTSILMSEKDPVNCRRYRAFFRILSDARDQASITKFAEGLLMLIGAGRETSGASLQQTFARDGWAESFDAGAASLGLVSTGIYSGYVTANATALLRDNFLREFSQLHLDLMLGAILRVLLLPISPQSVQPENGSLAGEAIRVGSHPLSYSASQAQVLAIRADTPPPSVAPRAATNQMISPQKMLLDAPMTQENVYARQQEFVTVVSDMLHSIPDLFVAYLFRFKPDAYEREIRVAYVGGDDNNASNFAGVEAPPDFNLFTSVANALLCIALKDIKIPDSENGILVDDSQMSGGTFSEGSPSMRCKNWLAAPHNDTADRMFQCPALGHTALRCLSELVASAVMQASRPPSDEWRERFADQLIFYLQHASRFLTYFIRTACVGPQPALLGLILNVLRWLEKAVLVRTDFQGLQSSVSFREKKRPQSTAGQLTPLWTHSKAVFACIQLVNQGIYFAAAAELNPYLTGYGLLNTWSNLARELIPMAHEHLAFVVEQLIESHMVVVCLLSKSQHPRSPLSASVLQTTIETVSQLIRYLFLQSTYQTEGGAQRDKADKERQEGQSILGGLLNPFGKEAATPAQSSAYHDAHMKLRPAIQTLVGGMLDVAESTLTGSSFSLTQSGSPASSPLQQPANSTGSFACRIVTEALKGVLALLFHNMESTSLECVASYLIRRKRQKPSHLVKNAMQPHLLISSEEKEIVRLVMSATKFDFLALLKASGTVLSRRASGLGAKLVAEDENGLVYLLNVALSASTTGFPKLGSSSEVLEKMKEVSNLLLQGTPTPTGVGLTATLVCAISSALFGVPTLSTTPMSPAQTTTPDFKDPRLMWFSPLLQRIVLLSAERMNLDGIVASCVAQIVEVLGELVWSRDHDTVLKIGASLVRDRLQPLVDGHDLKQPVQNEWALLKLLCSILRLAQNTPRALETSSSLRMMMFDVLQLQGFFRLSRRALQGWREVFYLVGHDKALFEAVLKKSHSSSALTLTAAAQAQDCVARGRALKRMAFFIYASAFRPTDLRTRLPLMRTFLYESFRQFKKADDHESVRFCFFLFRVLLVKVPQLHRAKLSGFWSLVIPEIVYTLNQLQTKMIAVLPTITSAGQPQQAVQTVHSPHVLQQHLTKSDRAVAIEVFKVLDLALVVAPNEFQPYKSIFFDDHNTITLKTFTPLMHALHHRITDTVLPRLHGIRSITPSNTRGGVPLGGSTNEAAARPLIALPECDFDSGETLPMIARGVCATAGVLSDVELQFALDEGEEELLESSGLAAGLVKRDDVFDQRYIEWLIDSDFVEGLPGTLDINSIADETSSTGEALLFHPRSSFDFIAAPQAAATPKEESSAGRQTPRGDEDLGRKAGEVDVRDGTSSA